MSKIKILPEILSNKIAAGEVVERPASVVKELVENALDAQSTRIAIEIESGGRSMIRVADNGAGMSRDDALLAPERYATSKIAKDQDLFAIGTLGFRGEALPSIASVSRFSLVTKPAAAESGTEIIIEGGTIKKVSDVGAPGGTMVSVGQLFYNTPARRKFLKTVNTEMGHIADTVARFAMGWPEVQFRLVHNRREIKHWPSAADHVDRIADVVGSEVSQSLGRIDFEDSFVSIRGWAAMPQITRSTSRGIYIYVNGRFVRDRIVQHALLEGYTGRLMKGKFPVAVIFIKVPYDQVDVNVHPAKHEIRFAQQNKIHNAVAGSVAEVLKFGDRSAWLIKKPSATQQRVEEPKIRYESLKNKRPAPYPEAGNESQLGRRENPAESRALKAGWSEAKIPRTAGQPATGNEQTAARIQSPLWTQKRFGDLRIIGQAHNTYILCESDVGLILIDQHAAHERVIFEQLKRRSADSTKASQKLLVPETLELGYREAQILEKLIPDLNELGLEIEPFGGNTFVIKSVPSLLDTRAPKPLVVEIVEKMAEIDFRPGLEKALDECLILMACHGAIRASQALSERQMKHLLDQLDQCDNPSHCPHGRPIWIRWSLKTLEKSFKRIV